ncbi:hypothetical protein QBC38DRAFT_519069 [Podospora fimiseda]|uniref:Uncharacterized protein n=1 Tax=Podospora fimiseda TaxID=252190 RepID=A0AAN7BFQ6_9PEZI|nr:hypothetical protein QBC38DRAFT_519069 [Podospora fimiseda]
MNVSMEQPCNILMAYGTLVDRIVTYCVRELEPYIPRYELDLQIAHKRIALLKSYYEIIRHNTIDSTEEKGIKALKIFLRSGFRQHQEAAKAAAWWAPEVIEPFWKILAATMKAEEDIYAGADYSPPKRSTRLELETGDSSNHFFTTENGLCGQCPGVLEAGYDAAVLFRGSDSELPCVLKEHEDGYYKFVRPAYIPVNWVELAKATNTWNRN